MQQRGGAERLEMLKSNRQLNIGYYVPSLYLCPSTREWSSYSTQGTLESKGVSPSSTQHCRSGMESEQFGLSVFNSISVAFLECFKQVRTMLSCKNSQNKGKDTTHESHDDLVDLLASDCHLCITAH